jgi:hypothetical protein
LGPEHRVTLQVWLAFAFWTGQAGDRATARGTYAEFLPVHERVFGPADAEVLGVRNQYASWVGEAGDPAHSRTLCADLIDRFTATRGPEHPDTLWTHENLAWFTGQAGDSAGARDHYAEVLELCAPASSTTSLCVPELGSWPLTCCFITGGYAGHNPALAPPADRPAVDHHTYTSRACS